MKNNRTSSDSRPSVIFPMRDDVEWKLFEVDAGPLQASGDPSRREVLLERRHGLSKFIAASSRSATLKEDRNIKMSLIIFEASAPLNLDTACAKPRISLVSARSELNRNDGSLSP